MDAYYAIHVDERGAATGEPISTRPAGSSIVLTSSRVEMRHPYSQDLFDGVSPALVLGIRQCKVPPFSEILLSGDLASAGSIAGHSGWGQLPGSGRWSSDDDWIAKYGTEYEADNFQAAIDYFGCGRTFVDDDEIDSGKSRLQYTITVYPNACDRAPASAAMKPPFLPVAPFVLLLVVSACGLSAAPGEPGESNALPTATSAEMPAARRRPRRRTRPRRWRTSSPMFSERGGDDLAGHPVLDVHLHHGRGSRQGPHRHNRWATAPGPVQ